MIGSISHGDKAIKNIYTMKTQIGERTVQVNDCVKLNTDKGQKLGTIVFISGPDNKNAIYTIEPSDECGNSSDLIDIPANETEKMIIRVVWINIFKEEIVYQDSLSEYFFIY